jgi:hypothetical protein
MPSCGNSPGRGILSAGNVRSENVREMSKAQRRYLGMSPGRIRTFLSAAGCASLMLFLCTCQNPSAADTSYWTTETWWTPVGKPAFSASNVNYTSIVLASDGTPYVVFEDGANGAYASVMKYDHGAWHYVGPVGFSGVTAQSTTLAFDPNGVLYVAFVAGSPSAVNVMKYMSATGWQTVGSANFSGAGNVWQVALAVDPSGVPCVAYVDATTNKATVMKCPGGTWIPVGPAGGFSGVGASNVALAFNKAGVPFVAFTDGSWGNQETAMTFDGTNWVLLGSQGFSGSSVAYVCLALDAGGVPYVAYGGAVSAGLVANVMKYSGGKWSSVGQPGFSSGTISGVSLALGPTGVPYVAYMDDSITNPDLSIDPITVMRFSGGGWAPVGKTGFTGGYAMSPSLVIDANGIPYVAYTDGLHGEFATVMSFQ